MSSKYCSVIYQNHNKLEKNINNILKQSSNKNKFKNSIIEEKEKDKDMSYILDQIKLFQLITYGYFCRKFFKR